ncbi:MAG: glycosyltransferase [Ktedonobacteraceae bacterium]|nr:glycosyltransferase [Ktedonobacteraceae bacterium]
MRIALVAPLVTTIAQPFVGGAQAVVADLARGLVERGHVVTLFARKGSQVPGVRLEPVDVPEHIVPSSFAHPGEERAADSSFFAQANLFFDLFLQLRRRSDEFDLVHVHAFDWPAFTCSALLADIPVFHTLHLPSVTPEINEALRILHRRDHPLTLITVSHACASTYADYTPIDHIIYNGLALAGIPFSAQVDADAPLLFAGRITPEKGVEAAIEIAALAKRRLLIAGGVYDRAYYEQRILPRLQQGGERVSYLGQLEHEALWQLMGQCCGLLFPIEWDEPFGLTAIEAMAAGTPVIAFRRGAAAEVIRHGETGFLVEPGNRVHAAALVDELPQIARMHCRRHVEQHFSLARMLDDHERVYSERLKDDRKRS